MLCSILLLTLFSCFLANEIVLHPYCEESNLREPSCNIRFNGTSKLAHFIVSHKMSTVVSSGHKDTESGLGSDGVIQLMRIRRIENILASIGSRPKDVHNW